MGRNGFPQQHYADDGMWMDTHAAQQQHNYALHDNNSYHKQQFPPAGMHMNGHHGYGTMLPNGHHGHGFGTMLPNGHHGHGYGNNHMMHGGINSSHHPFSNGGAKFNSGGGYFSEEEYEDHREEYHHGAGKVKVDEMRYERHNYGGGDNHGFYAIPYDHMNMNRKPHHGIGGHKAEWISKGV